MARDEDPRFRITTWPGVVDVPKRLAVPPLVGWALPGDVVPRLHPAVGTATFGPDEERFVALPIPKDVAPGESPLVAAARAASDRLPEGLAARARAGHAEALAEVSRLLAPMAREHGTIYVDERNHVLVDLPDDLFLQEFLAVDLAEPQHSYEFWDTWGPLLLPPALLVHREVVRAVPIPRQWPADVQTIDPFVAELVPDRTAMATAGRHRDAVYEILLDYLEDEGLGEGEEAQIAYTRDADGSTVEIQSMTGYSLLVQWFLMALYQSVFETWARLVPDDADPATLADPARAELVEVWDRHDLPVPASSWELLDTCIDAVNAGAAAFGPRIELAHPRLEELGTAYFRPIPRVLTAMCLQAVAFVSEGFTARLCGYELCGKWFTRQRGRAKQGQQRATGVLYCSASCAKAAAQRAYRRRQRGGST
jgi:hypothetical protein